MELWIRSQNRNSLVKISNIFLEDDTSLETDTQEFGMMTLGTYKTKERALEVLDEIQNKITKFNLKTDYNCTDNIYKMPED